MTNKLKPLQLDSVERLGEALSKEEVCNYFGVSYEDLADDERKQFDINFNKAKIKLKLNAYNKLKERFEDPKTGGTLALDVLVRFGELWEQSTTEEGRKILIEYTND